MAYRLAAVGGTFDHFHIGHQQLLLTAVAAADTTIIGITHPKLSLHKSLASLIEPFATRQQNVAAYLDHQGYQGKYTLVELTDPFGPTATDPNIDALIVSQMTQAGADAVNQARQARGLPILPVIVTPMVADEAGQHLSSSQIRAGQITRYGKVYKQLFTQTIHFSPAQLKQLQQLSQPQFSESLLTSATSVVLVGDMVTQYFLEHHLSFNYAIVDGHTRRQPTQYSYPQLRSLSGLNQPGTINATLAMTIIGDQAARPEGTIYQVNGEEDLLAFIPCISEPIGSLVIYGQPEVGIVMINLTEANKLWFAKFINPRFL